MAQSAQQESSYIPINDREQAALSYASSGMRVLPLEPRGKKPFRGQGVDHATTDQDRIRAWFRAEPEINVGIAAGDGLIILDADSPSAVEFMASQPPTLTARTGKGKHFYYSSERPFKNSVKKLRDGLDVKTDRGYVVAPPSIHESGTIYTWEHELAPVAPLPAENRELAGESRKRTGTS